MIDITQAPIWKRILLKFCKQRLEKKDTFWEVEWTVYKILFGERYFVGRFKHTNPPNHFNCKCETKENELM